MESTVTNWKLGMDLPYVVSFGENALLAISLPAVWVKADGAGRPLLLPAAVRAVDRLRVVFMTQEKISRGFILSIRKAMGVSQEEFGRKLGVSKMTVSRWERGSMRPSRSADAAIRGLQARLAKEGVKIDGRRNTTIE